MALGVVAEAHTEVAFHLGNLRTLRHLTVSPMTVVETPLELTPGLHSALGSHAVRKILATLTPPPGP